MDCFDELCFGEPSAPRAHHPGEGGLGEFMKVVRVLASVDHPELSCAAREDKAGRFPCHRLPQMAMGGLSLLTNSCAIFLLPTLVARLPDIGMLGGIAELALSLWLMAMGGALKFRSGKRKQVPGKLAEHSCGGKRIITGTALDAPALHRTPQPKRKAFLCAP
jgi:hypothetical protein